MSRQKGTAKTGGRKIGTPNKYNAEIKDMICQALSNVGGISYLENQAIKNPNAFLGLVGKVLPLQVSGDPENPHKMILEWAKPEG